MSTTSCWSDNPQRLSASHRRTFSPSLAGRLADASDERWNLLLACVAGYILTSVARVHQVFPALTALRIAWLTGGLAILLYVLDRSEHGRLRHLAVPTTAWLVGLLVWMTLSVPGSLWEGNSFDLVFDNFAKTVIMYLVVAGAIRGVRDVERLATVYWMGAAIYALVIVQRFEIGAGDAWRLDNLYYYDANEFATFAVAALPLVLHSSRAAHRFSGRVAGLAGLATLTLAFVYAGSRGGFIALVAVVGFIVLRYKGVALRWRLAGAFLGCVVVLGAMTDRFWQEVSTIATDRDYNVTEEAGRLNIWRRGIGYMLQYPVLGVGPNNFAVAEGTLSPQAQRQFGIGVRWSAAHNSFIQIGAELGIPGLMIFVAVIASAFGALRRSRAAQSAALARTRELGHALAASLVGLLVGAFFLSLGYSEMLYTLIALAVGLEKVATATPEESY
jgi:O-antigen ligase